MKHTAKLKPVTVKLTMKVNPLWKKQMAIVKKAVQKLNKIKAYTIKEG